ncbi:MAG: DUF3667 domain-containing protein [Pseudomonadales bacterium]|nr:DUF3667 domain-containing protein [Pseudomonadales bacterium]
MSDVTDNEIQSRPAYCSNCHTPLAGPYCYQCGQSCHNPPPLLVPLIAESLEAVFSVNSRTAKTLYALFFKPGFLTQAYFAGRRAAYLPPLRLYIISSLLFFFYLTAQNFLAPNAERVFQLQNGPVVADGTAELVISPIGLTQPDGQPTSESQDQSRERLPFSDEWLPETGNAGLDERLAGLIEKFWATIQQNPQGLTDAILDVSPPIMFLTVPLFALVMKLVYLGSGVYYTQHLVLAIHNHAFYFLALLLSWISELAEKPFGTDVSSAIIMGWVAVYMFLSLRNYYQQSFLVTACKYLVLVVSHFALFISGLMLALLAGTMTL